jgi:hypothetical protein
LGSKSKDEKNEKTAKMKVTETGTIRLNFSKIPAELLERIRLDQGLVFR